MTRAEIKSMVTSTAKQYKQKLDPLYIRALIEEIADAMATDRANNDEVNEEAADACTDAILQGLDRYTRDLADITPEQRSRFMLLLDDIADGLEELPTYNTQDKINVLKIKLY
jgi:tRNA A37 N6-isopentenylltransferase MiaA